MKTISLIVVLSICSVISFAQSKVTILESQIKVGSGTEKLYYGFESGDQVIFTFSEKKGKDIKEVEILEYPDKSKWSVYKSNGNGKTLSISERGIYVFRFRNTNIAARYVNVKIERIPSSSATQNFNTNITWKSITDTTFYTVTEKYVTHADTTLQEVLNTNMRLEKFATNYPYLKVVEATLPENTDSWAYYVGVGNSGKLAMELAELKLKESDDPLVDQFSNYNPLFATAFGNGSYIEHLEGNNNVSLSCISDIANVNLFKTNQAYSQYKSDKGEVISGNMTTPKVGKLYLGLVNNHLTDGIDVQIKIVAAIIVRKYATREVEKFKTNTYDKPFLSE